MDQSIAFRPSVGLRRILWARPVQAYIGGALVDVPGHFGVLDSKGISEREGDGYIARNKRRGQFFSPFPSSAFYLAGSLTNRARRSIHVPAVSRHLHITPPIALSSKIVLLAFPTHSPTTNHTRPCVSPKRVSATNAKSKSVAFRNARVDRLKSDMRDIDYAALKRDP